MDAGAHGQRGPGDVRSALKAEQCRFCKSRVGARRCLTLECWICSTCCGKERGRAVRCLPTCPYLVEAEARWRARRSRELAEAWAAWQKRDPELPWLYIEGLAKVLAAFLHKNFATDSEVEQALFDLDQALSPIVIISAAPGPIGKILSSSFEAKIREGKIDREKLRKAAQALRRWLAEWRIPEDNRRFVRALLGTYPPPKESLIIQP